MISSPVELRARILAEATRLFVTLGYHGIAMREIAEAVGVSKAGLYYHFKDKADLFLAILTAHLDTIAQIAAAARQAPTARAQIAQMARGLLALPPEQRAIIRLASQEITHIGPQARAAFNQTYQQKFIGQVEEILREGISRGELRPLDARLATWILLGMLYPFLAPAPEREPDAQEQVIDLLLAIFFDGAAASPG